MAYMSEDFRNRVRDGLMPDGLSHPDLDLRYPTRVPLAACVCGEHVDCPDGWHYGADVPCDCTPDCVLEGDTDGTD